MKAPEADPAATVSAYLAALNRADVDAAASYVSEGFVNEHTSTLGSTVVGRETYRSRLQEFLAEFAGVHYEVEQSIVEGANVAVAYRMSAAWRQPEAPASAARPFLIRGMFRFRVESGLIVHRVDYWDSADFQRQVRAGGPLKA